MDTRACVKCGIEKPIDSFYSSKNKYGTTYKRCKECQIEFQRYKAFGVCNVKYAEMLELQNGVCAICECKLESSRYTKLTVDHDHKTGKVRGLLCTACNTAIGLLKDSQVRLRSAIIYLSKHGVEEIVSSA
jgi:Autographiviridae endonuclease VII